MQNETISTVPPPGQTPQQAINSAPSKQKVSLNPFSHLKLGFGSLIKYNLGSGLIAILISSLVSVVLTIAILYAVFLSTTILFVTSLALSVGGSNTSGLFKILGVFIGVAILASLIMGYFGSVITRIIITGTRGQKESVGHAFSFVIGRLPKIIVTYLFIFAIFLFGSMVLLIVVKFVPLLGILLGLVGIIAVIIFGLRILYVPLILVDDEPAGKPLEVIRRSSALWKKSSGALVIYGLLWLVIYVILNILIGNQNSYSGVSPYNGTASGFLAGSTAFSFAIGGVLLSSFLSNCFAAISYSGASSIYNDARLLINGQVPNTGTSAAPVSPVASSSLPVSDSPSFVTPLPVTTLSSNESPIAPRPPVSESPDQFLPPQPPTSA